MIKNIAVWKVIGLYIITLGIYGFVWLARRRSEMIEHYKLSVPHWLWLVAPAAIAFALLLPAAFIIYGVTSQTASTASIIYGFLLLALFGAYGISLWWMYRFGRAAQIITEGKVPVVWTMLNTIFLGPVMLFMFQYYFNRAPKSVDSKSKPKYQPSKNFVILSTVLIVASLPMAVTGLMQFPELAKEGSILQSQSRKIDALYQETEQLAKEHKACVDKLEADFPGKLSAEDEPAYTKAYDACEEIRIKQHAKVDEYNTTLEKW